MRMWNGLEVAEYVPDWFVNGVADIRILETPKKGDLEDVISKLLVDNGEEHKAFWQVLEINEGLRLVNQGRQCRAVSSALIVDALSSVSYKAVETYSKERKCYSRALKNTEKAKKELIKDCKEIVSYIPRHGYSVREALEMRDQEPNIVALKVMKLEETIECLISDVEDFIKVLEYKNNTVTKVVNKGNTPIDHKQLFVNVNHLFKPWTELVKEQPLAHLEYIIELITEMNDPKVADTEYSREKIREVIRSEKIKPL